MDDSSGTISIAMEYCEGGSLYGVYREVKKLGGRTGEKVLGKVAEGVLNGLTYLHGRKIIHRGTCGPVAFSPTLTDISLDIKPSNILLTRSGQVRLCDFGVSGEFGTKGDANTFIGTSYYMAPERITGKSYTITSDVWSLGVTLLEVAQHRFPFPADGTEMQPKAGLIDLLTYIVRQSIPKLKDEEENGIKWSENFKYFIECWYVPKLRSFQMNWYEADINGGAVWKRNHHEEQRHGACSNIPGWLRCAARKSIWSISCDKFGTGRIKDRS